MLTEDRTATLTAAGSAATTLRDRFADAVVTAGDADWDAARMAFNLTIDQRPAAVARPRTAEEAAAIVAAARDAGLRIAPQGSSHNTATLGSLDDTVIVKLERMTDVELDADAGTARVEAGARWWDVVPQASEAGFAALHGSSPEINVVGYSVGGGMGWLARKHGLQANRVTAVEIVTADGELRRVDADNDPDLFWAVRGGGGNFGLVTAIEFALIPLSEVYAGALFFPFERAAEVLGAYREWTAGGLPEEITSIGRTLQLPDLEIIPEIVRGKSFAIVEAAFIGSEADGAELLAPLRELGPEMDTFAMVPPSALAELHMDPIEPVPYVGTHALLGEFTQRALDEALAAVGPGAGSPVSFEIRHGGGALARGGDDHGAIAEFRGEYLMFGVAPVMDPAAMPVLEADLARFAAAFAPDEAGRYLNFTEVPHDVEAMFPSGHVERLRRIRTEYDPDGLFRANHAL
jgi:FAD/FMN-containing dehydrogenase